MNNKRKRITPMVAIILLLMLTVAVAGCVSWWLSSINESPTYKRSNEVMCQELGGKIFIETKCVTYDNETIREIPEHLIETIYYNTNKTDYAIEYRIPSSKQINRYCQSLGYYNGWLSLVCSKENEVLCHEKKGDFTRNVCVKWLD